MTGERIPRLHRVVVYHDGRVLITRLLSPSRRLDRRSSFCAGQLDPVRGARTYEGAWSAALNRVSSASADEYDTIGLRQVPVVAKSKVRLGTGTDERLRDLDDPGSRGESSRTERLTRRVSAKETIFISFRSKRPNVLSKVGVLRTSASSGLSHAIDVTLSLALAPRSLSVRIR